MTAPDDPAAEDRIQAAATWCTVMAEGRLAARQRTAFETWLAEDVRNGAAFEEMAALWDGLGARSETPEMLRLRAGALDWLRLLNGRRWSVSRAPVWKWPLMLAIAAVMLLAAYGVVHALSRATEIETGVGERRVVALDDGSRVSLDAASKVEWRFDRHHRNLTLLAGRAKFDVAKDPTRPFAVTAGDRTVVATGTSFSIELLRRQMQVVLYEGHVTVLDNRGSGPSRPLRLAGRTVAADRVLTPGHELVALQGGADAQVMPADVDRSLSWEMGQLDFRNEPLSEAAERMNRYSDRKLVVDDSATAALPIDGVFRVGDTEAFVESLASLYPVAVVQDDNAIHLRRANKAAM